MTDKKTVSPIAQILESAMEDEHNPLLDNDDDEVRLFFNDGDLPSTQAQRKTTIDTKQDGAATKLRGGLNLVEVDPHTCRPWQFADRPSNEMGDIEALASSIQQHGQQEPVLLRPIEGQPGIKYEVVFGNRRWQACRKLSVPLLGVLKNLSDKQAAVFQKEENENREDLSDYARAQSYRKQIEGGVFSSEKELSQVLGISPQVLNGIMAYLRIPEALVDEIRDLKLISRKTATKLATLSKDKKNHKALFKLAEKIRVGEVHSQNIEKYIQKYQLAGSEHKQSIDLEKIFKFNSKFVSVREASNGDVIIKVNNKNTAPNLALKIRDSIEEVIKVSAKQTSTS